ncbi:WD repeat-containing protein 26 homolog isoform X1 [Macadamia integrifolia]|uniref:WD repeat-containing protein 26 homolog isoform X1 n=1 Tax=Macadamia integrifolia TaxID=60698 RepID=UPI001C52CE83|nr:WD repeat-containing protein 26 homolog isoform X1 [Macadamia integrifolia]XP_042478237.1 WD repeat-containing protein 26 homolog isoform X1 [Macadamia integrifolia]XP_042478238.1 WD repeat-containing protein 26 homolog isoform X1 [Macadamia integrifolia]
MGGVEDDEPPTKRVKASSGELRSLLNYLPLTEPLTGSLGDSMARPLPSQGDEEMVGTKGLIKRVEFVRIITKALYTLGYEKSGALLEQESGIPLHPSMVNLFRQQVLGGSWDESVATLHKIGLSDETIVKSASFLILEQKFFEFLERDKIMDALMTLRTEIAPLCINTSRVHELSACIVSPSRRLLLGVSSQDIVNANSRLKLLEKLQKLLPPTVMIPERRLEHLVEQALDVQREACVFHNSLDSALSLYSDHQCGKDQIPSRTLQVLQAHRDEVWYLQFSHNGKYLASSSNDRSAIIWEVNEDGGVSLKHTLTGHQKPVLTVSWSPDDRQLLTCGIEEAIRRWDVSSGECLHIYEKAGVGLISCGWLPDGKRLFSGMNDKSICMWDLDGKELECWKGPRTLKISDMALTNDGKRIITMCRENTILLLDRDAKGDRLIEEDQTITSFSLSRDNKFLLVNLLNQEIHLWSIDGDIKLVSKYKGHKRTRFVIRSCFGGFDQAFIASGSEDSQVYIWHRGTGELLETLPGHSGAVNCVSWNPADPHMLASASDDRTIRIWGLNRVNLKRKDTYSNGIIHHCNGGI